MIRSFKHKGLKKLYEAGSRKGIKLEHFKRLRMILARLDACPSAGDMDLPGLNLHPLEKKGKADLRGHWSVTVSGNSRVTFRFEDNDAFDVDYVDYH